MTQPAQTSAEARRRPLVQYVISRVLITALDERTGGIHQLQSFRVHRSPGGSKPSHELIDKPQLVPLCDPPLSELAQECSHCEAGVSYGSPCLSCRGTGSLPPMRDGKRIRLLPEAP